MYGISVEKCTGHGDISYEEGGKQSKEKKKRDVECHSVK
jgi:hypothetical protein